MNQPFELIEHIEPFEHSPSNQNHQTSYQCKAKNLYF